MSVKYVNFNVKLLYYTTSTPQSKEALDQALSSSSHFSSTYFLHTQVASGSRECPEKDGDHLC